MREFVEVPGSCLEGGLDGLSCALVGGCMVRYETMRQ